MSWSQGDGGLDDYHRVELGLNSQVVVVNKGAVLLQIGLRSYIDRFGRSKFEVP